jgi:hypothetical protein
MSKGLIYSNQQSLWGSREIVGFGDNAFMVSEINKDDANEYIAKNHYSGGFYSASYIHLGVFVSGDFVGALQYGYAMNPASCSSVVSGTEIDQYLELNRMHIMDNVGEYPESKAISYSIKFIKSKYPKVRWIQSFADERCGGFGIVYQACSFSYYGEHTTVFWEVDGKFYHNSLMTRDPSLRKSASYLQHNKDKAIKHELRQFRYIKFLDQREKKKCLLKEQPYPKHYR